MTFFVFPWSILSVFAAIVLLLIVRECIIIIRTPAFHPERKMAIFNFAVLLLFFAASTYGIRLLVARDAQFAELFYRYPNSRYAPEREFFTQTGDWVYLTKDPVESVVDFYRNTSSPNGFRVTFDANHADKLFLFEKNGRKIFLTIVKEDKSTVLYFSQTGEIKLLRTTNQ